MYPFHKYCPNYFRKKIMISDKLYASTVSNLSSLYLYCKEIKIKNLEHSKNSPLLVLSPPLSPLTAKQSVFLCIQVRGNSQTKRSGVRLCTGAAHNFQISVPPYGRVMLAHFACVRLLLLHFTKPILRKKLTALQSTFPTPLPPPPQKNEQTILCPFKQKPITLPKQQQ